MKFAARLSLLAVLFLTSTLSLAWPVAYEGSFSLMSENEPDMQCHTALYSFSSRLATGMDYIHDGYGGTEANYFLARLGWLIKRWNGENHQANIYLTGALGAVESPHHGTFGLASAIAVDADFETRDIYFAARARGNFSDVHPTMDAYRFRAGFAPYRGDYEELNTWFILQVEHFPSHSVEPLRIGPLLRFYYKNALWELGMTGRGIWNFNFSIRL